MFVVRDSVFGSCEQRIVENGVGCAFVDTVNNPCVVRSGSERIANGFGEAVVVSD